MGAKIFLALTVMLMVAGLLVCDQRDARAGEVTPAPGYKVLDPIRHGNLTVFPVVAAKSYPTGEFLTLDEGLRSGEVGHRSGKCARAGSETSKAGLKKRRSASEPAGAGQQFQTAAAVAGG